MWQNGEWVEDGTMPDRTPVPSAPYTADHLREAAVILRGVAETAAESPEYRDTLNLGTDRAARERITGGALALEALAEG